MLKAFVLACAAFFISFGLSAQNNVHVEDVEKHLGEVVTVCDKIYDIKAGKESDAEPIFIKMGGSFPRHNVTVRISAEDRKNFTENPETVYAQKDVCITGRVINIKGKLYIVISKPTEIQIGTE
jgi:hypothetical protein